MAFTDPQPQPEQLALLSALADGTISPEDRVRAEAAIAGSSELRARYERERSIVELLQAARSRDRAPASVRATVDGQRTPSRSRPRRRAPYVGAIAGALATAGVVLAFALSGGSVGSPTVSDAAMLALRGSAQPAPAPSPTAPTSELASRVQGVSFPNWTTSLGWRASGSRIDRFAGRRAATVFYDRDGEQVAYTILATPALARPRAGTRARLNGYELSTLSLRSRTVVTWRRDGHTCILSASGVPATTLQELATWNAPGTAS